jgi:nucleotide-binding universal stress UspA family protein
MSNAKIARILVPVDLGPTSEELLRYGLAWADFFDSELHVLHVVSYHLPPPGVAAVGLDERAVNDWVGDARTSLANLIATLPIDAARVHTAVRVGRPGGEIEAYATEHRTDLIIMASRRRGSIARAALGSVAEQVVRRAPCPVITVPPDVKIPHWIGAVDTILLPVDLGETTPTAMTYARGLAGMLGSALHVMHVVAPPWERQLTYLPPATVVGQMERLTGVRAEGADPTGSVKSIVRVGDAATSIEDYAEAIHAGLIVMATHGRSTFAQIVLSSVTRALLAHAACPVLTLNARVCRDHARIAWPSPEPRASALPVPAQGPATAA